MFTEGEALPTFNLHRLFFEAPEKNDLLCELGVPDKEHQGLRDARDLIRATVRSGFASWQETLDRRIVLSEIAVRKSVADPKLRPKFRMQGSASYHTLNLPARQPPQRIDIDDGIYLPVSFLAESGNPVIASAGYFRLVEVILAPLCKKNSWKLREKTSCVRVELSQKAYIDLPLYAIPDNEFDSLVETATITKMAADRMLIKDGIELADALYEAFPEDELRLAHREKGWIKSDPRLIERWFKDAVETHGLQVRRVCRYFKAWRDHHWDACCLSSITIMKCVVDAFDSLRGSVDPKRDDLAVLEVAARLQSYFCGAICNPVLDGDLNDNWSDQDREAFKQQAVDLHHRINLAIRESDSRSVALTELTRAFGPRIPQDITLVALTAEATVISYKATKMPAPAVHKTTSG